MLNLNNTDVLEAGASVDAVVDFVISGLKSNDFATMADGQLTTTATTAIYTASGAESIVSIQFTNTHTSAVTINLTYDPTDSGTPRRLIPKDLSLESGYTALFDGQRLNVYTETGGMVSSYDLHASKHKAGGTDDLLSEPGEIGGTTPSTGNFTIITSTGDVSLTTTKKLLFDGPSGNDYIIGSAADTIDIYTGGVKAVTVDSSQGVLVPNGNVHIGGTGAGANLLDVEGEMIITGGAAAISDNENGLHLRFDTANNVGIIDSTHNGVANRDLHIRALGTEFYANSTLAMSISSTGNVHIGGSGTGDELLHLESSSANKPILKIETTNAGADPCYIDFYKNSASPGYDSLGVLRYRGRNSTPADVTYAEIKGISAVTTAGAEDGRIIQSVMMNGTSRSYIDLNGNTGQVLINQAQQDVDTIIYGNSATAALTVQGSDNLVYIPAAYSNDMNGDTMRDLQINDSGELGYDSSSERGKAKIVPIRGTERIYDLEVVNYVAKLKGPFGYVDAADPEGYTQVGLIAEQVEGIMPELVFYDELPGGKRELAGVHYNKPLIAAMLKEIQKHKKTIDSFESRITKLEQAFDKAA